MTFIALAAEEYWAAIADAAESGVVGGSKAETIYTWNVGHFQQVESNVAMLIRTP
jgi:hypothetical protein